MKSERQFLNLYFQVHQPRRLRKFHFFDVGSASNYFDDDLNKEILTRIAKDCYLPANKLLLDLIKLHPELRVTFSISGIALEQFEKYSPDVIQSFRRLAQTGCVEFLGETYYHSLAYFVDPDEFVDQIALHRRKLHELIGVDSRVFRNTELIYSDAIGSLISDLGFSGMFVDGVDKILRGKTANNLYRHPEKDLVLFPRNFRLSDDIAFRYSDKTWSEWPLSTHKFSRWINAIPSDQRFVCLAMDYETFGEHQKASSGIFHFLKHFILTMLTSTKFQFVTPSEAVRFIPVQDVISNPCAISWADVDRDLSAWLGNDIQRDAFDSLKKLHNAAISSGNDQLIEMYRHLQTSDHFYYMSTKGNSDGNVHQYFSPYRSPYEAFMNYMNVVTDLELRLRKSQTKIRRTHKLGFHFHSMRY